MYLTTLEAVKSAVAERSAAMGTGEASAAGLANFVAGATASLVTQSVIVPVRTVENLKSSWGLCPLPAATIPVKLGPGQGEWVRATSAGP